MATVLTAKAVEAQGPTPRSASRSPTRRCPASISWCSRPGLGHGRCATAGWQAGEADHRPGAGPPRRRSPRRCIWGRPTRSRGPHGGEGAHYRRWRRAKTLPALSAPARQRQRPTPSATRQDARRPTSSSATPSPAIVAGRRSSANSRPRSLPIGPSAATGHQARHPRSARRHRRSRLARHSEPRLRDFDKVLRLAGRARRVESLAVPRREEAIGRAVPRPHFHDDEIRRSGRRSGVRISVRPDVPIVALTGQRRRGGRGNDAPGAFARLRKAGCGRSRHPGRRIARRTWCR